ncbi:MAG TPA: dynamin family protein [Acidobacteriota bacterium]
MMETILTERQEALRLEARGKLSELQVVLSRQDIARADLETLAASVRQLDELFLLVVVGEFNSGKSTFINALLGQAVLEEGVTPTTTRIQVVQHGAAEKVTAPSEPGAMVAIGAPVELLRRMKIVDTPGTNALERSHQAITEEFVPRSDLVLFVTSADRPFTDSERSFLERIREWGKKLVLVVNKVDILRGDQELERIETFMRENAERLIGLQPQLFSVSARLALEAKLEGDAERLKRSRFETLERYLVETLDQSERVRLKLLNPLGVGLKLAKQWQAVFEGRLELLAHDFATLEDVERQLDLYREDLTREFRFRLTDVDNILHQFEQRGGAFFDETLRLPRILDLLNKAKLKADFERQVIADAPRQIEIKVGEIIDWMVASELRQWRAITEHLARRRSESSERTVGAIGGFELDRKRLLDTVGRAASRTVESYDREAEAARMAESVQASVAGIALLEVGAIGLGTIVTLAATTQLADVTGIVAAGTLAALGLFVLPARRRAAKAELSRKIAELRRKLMEALSDQFGHEVERSLHRIGEAIAPYTRFVRAERGRLDEARDQLAGIRAELEQLRGKVEALR